MNKKLMFTLIGAAFILIASGAWCAHRYFRSAAYFRSRLPQQYLACPGLPERPASLQRRLHPLFRGSKVRELAVDSVRRTLIVGRWEMDYSEGRNTVKRSVYYRLNAAGELLDSLAGDGEEGDWGYEFNGHLLYNDAYDNYLTGGGPQRHAYEHTYRGDGMEAAALQALISGLQARAGAVQQKYIDDADGSREALFFSIGGKVLRVLLPGDHRVEWELNPGKVLRHLRPLTEYGYNWAAGAPLRVAYFLKETYHRASRPAFMSPAPMNRPANWEGTAYFSLAHGTDTLFFQHPFYYYPGDKGNEGYYGNHQWGKLDYFPLEDFGFQLLTVGYDTDDRHRLDGCYLVLPRK